MRRKVEVLREVEEETVRDRFSYFFESRCRAQPGGLRRPALESRIEFGRRLAVPSSFVSFPIDVIRDKIPRCYANRQWERLKWGRQG